MSDKQTKKWYTSVTIISSILAVLSGIFGDSAFGQFIAEPETASLLSDAITGIAGMFAVWGRLRASRSIGKEVL